MKQWLLAFRPHKFGNVGANPTDHPSPENEKATYNCPVVVPLNGARQM